MTTQRGQFATLEWPKQSVVWIELLYYMFALMASVALAVLAYMSFDGLSPGVVFLWTILPTIVIHSCGERLASVVAVARRASEQSALPVTFDHLLRQSLASIGNAYFWLALIYLPLVAVLVVRPNFIAFLLFLSACSSILLGWLCHARGLSAAPLPLWCLRGLFQIPHNILCRKLGDPGLASAIVCYCLVMSLSISPNYLSVGLDTAFATGLTSLILALFIHPISVPFVWISTGANPTAGLVLLLLSLGLQVPPALAFIRRYRQPLPLADWEDLLNPRNSFKLAPRENHLDRVRKIEAPQPGDADQVWSARKLRAYWTSNNLPPYVVKPTAESGFLDTFGVWSIGFTPNGTMVEKILRGIVMPLLILGFFATAIVALLRLTGGDEFSYSFTIVPLVMLMYLGFYLLYQYSVRERAAMSLCNHGYPLRLSAIDQWIRQSMLVPGWGIDLIAALALMSLTGFSIVAGALMIILLRLLRNVLHLHVLHNTWVRGNMPKDSPTPAQIGSLIFIIGQVIWFVILLVACSPNDSASASPTVWKGVFFWLIALFLPMLGHWLLIRYSLARQVGKDLRQAVI